MNHCSLTVAALVDIRSDAVGRGDSFLTLSFRAVALVSPFGAGPSDRRWRDTEGNHP